jgi:hypothetical protein
MAHGMARGNCGCHRARHGMSCPYPGENLSARHWGCDVLDCGHLVTGVYLLTPSESGIRSGPPSVCPKIDELWQKRVRRSDIGALEFQAKAMSLS